MVQNIIVTRRWPPAIEAEFRSTFSEQYNIEFNQTDEPFNQEQLRAALDSAEIVCPTVTDKLDASLLNRGEVKTRLLANFGAGFNHIDLAAAGRAGIRVTNTPGVLTEATAEIALTLLLSVARRTGEGERLLRANAWQGWHPTHMLSTQVTGKTLGIIGMGRIGLDLAKKAHLGLGMQIVYYNRTRLDEKVEDALAARYLALDELLASSDFVSLHCPANPSTQHLIDAEALRLMPQHAFLINTARGDVVDEVALVAALEKGEIAGAGLDVYAAEPRLTAGLQALENAVLLPHMGSGTVETRHAMGRCAIANVLAYTRHAPLPNEVVSALREEEK